MYNRLRLVEQLTGSSNDQAGPRFVALRLEVNDSPNLGITTTVTQVSSTSTERRRFRRPGTFFTPGAERELLRRRQKNQMNGGDNAHKQENSFLVSYKVPLGNGYRIRVETERALPVASLPRLTTHRRMPEFVLRRKISGLCRKISTRLSYSSNTQLLRVFRRS